MQAWGSKSRIYAQTVHRAKQHRNASIAVRGGLGLPDNLGVLARLGRGSIMETGIIHKAMLPLLWGTVRGNAPRA